MIKNLPQGWRVEELNKCGKIVTGKTPSKFVKEYWSSQDVPFVKPDDFKNDDIIEFESGKDFISKQGFAKATKIPPYSVLVTCIGNIGKILINKNFITTNQQINTIIPYQNIHYKYLAYAIQKIKPIMIKRANAPVVPIINKTDFGKFEIPLPPRPQQEKIVKVLDKSALLVEQQKQLIEKYDVFLKSKFIEMFGDPITNPMGWEVKKLKEISTLISSGSTPKGGSQVYVEKGILFFRSQNVWKNKILLDDIAYIDNETHLKMKKSSLKHKDILITKTGRFNTENSSLGRAALFLGADNSANINGHVYLVRLKKSMAHEFVTYILTTNEYREYIRSVCVGGIDKRQINKIHLEEFPIIFPPIELQKEFSLIVKKIEAIKEKETQKLNYLETLHVSLMDKAFKGEIA